VQYTARQLPFKHPNYSQAAFVRQTFTHHLHVTANDYNIMLV
jgi:hypothetical protein